MRILNIIGSIAILVIALLIYSYITDPYSKYQISQFFSSSKEKLVSSIEKIPTPEKSTCEQNAKSLIPNKIVLKYVYNHDRWILNDNKKYGINKWSDGSEIKAIALSSYSAGSGKGENINHFYYRSFNDALEVAFKTKSPEIAGFSYKKQIISKNGEISGDREFTIRPILKPIPNTMQEEIEYWRESELFHYNYQDFEIVEPNFVHCNWIEE